jgi:hypothetical protein
MAASESWWRRLFRRKPAQTLLPAEGNVTGAE